MCTSIVPVVTLVRTAYIPCNTNFTFSVEIKLNLTVGCYKPSSQEESLPDSSSMEENSPSASVESVPASIE